MSEVTINLDNLTEEQKTILQLEEKKKPYWVPKDGEMYFYVMSYANVGCTLNDKSFADDGAFSIGNCFKTEEEAQEAATRLKMQAKWKRLSLEAGEADNPWDGKHEHYYVFYWSDNGQIYVKEHKKKKDANIYFPTMASIRKAIDNLGEENVKKYILGVKE